MTDLPAGPRRFRGARSYGGLCLRPASAPNVAGAGLSLTAR